MLQEGYRSDKVRLQRTLDKFVDMDDQWILVGILYAWSVMCRATVFFCSFSYFIMFLYFMSCEKRKETK